MSRPRLLVCGFGAFPAAPRNPAGEAVEALARSGWAPAAADVDFLTVPVAWRGAVEAVHERRLAAAYDGVLVVGVAVEADGFRVETLGRNLAAPGRPDHLGELWPAATISADAPATLAVTAPWAAMLEALQAAGLPARASDHAGEYLCNFMLFRLLLEAAAPAAGFLHVPQARECEPGAAFALSDIEAAVAACAGAFAADLAAATDPAARRRTA
ncbi:hypothetical protein [Phenylobacterium sp.]|uniref:pyroglutamyl-peptidase I family protein n=1 Tax=Phenylobacterium sp. TaxID=1871053 RepID=UPI0035B42D68